MSASIFLATLLLLSLIQAHTGYRIQLLQNNSPDVRYDDAEIGYQSVFLNFPEAPDGPVEVELSSNAFFFCNGRSKINLVVPETNIPQEIVLSATPIPGTLFSIQPLTRKGTKVNGCPVRDIADGNRAAEVITATIDGINTDLFVSRNVSTTGHCRSTGDPHFASFDGKIFHSQQIGFHTLVKSPTFTMVSHHKKCGRRGRTVSCNDGFVMKYKDEVFSVVGKEVHFFSAKQPNRDTLGRMEFMEVTNSNGLFSVHIVDGSNVITAELKTNNLYKLEMSASFKSRVSGMCGNYDGSQQNDGDTVPTPPGKCLGPCNVGVEENPFFICGIPVDGLTGEGGVKESAPDNIDTSSCWEDYGGSVCSTDLRGYARTMKKRSNPSSESFLHRTPILFKRDINDQVDIVPENEEVILTACAKVTTEVCDEAQFIFEECKEDLTNGMSMVELTNFETQTQILCGEDNLALMDAMQKNITLQGMPEDEDEEDTPLKDLETLEDAMEIAETDNFIEPVAAVTATIDLEALSASEMALLEATEPDETPLHKREYFNNFQVEELDEADYEDERILEKRADGAIERGTNHRNDPLCMDTRAKWIEAKDLARSLGKASQDAYKEVWKAERNRLAEIKQLFHAINDAQQHVGSQLKEDAVVEADQDVDEAHILTTSKLEHLKAAYDAAVNASFIAADSLETHLRVVAEFTQYRRENHDYVNWNATVDRIARKNLTNVEKYENRIAGLQGNMQAEGEKLATALDLIQQLETNLRDLAANETELDNRLNSLKNNGEPKSVWNPVNENLKQVRRGISQKERDLNRARNMRDKAQKRVTWYEENIPKVQDQLKKFIESSNKNLESFLARVRLNNEKYAENVDKTAKRNEIYLDKFRQNLARSNERVETNAQNLQDSAARNIDEWERWLKGKQQQRVEREKCLGTIEKAAMIAEINGFGKVADCPTAVQNVECSGKGTCQIQGCICELGYVGPKCDQIITKNGVVPFEDDL